MSISVYMTLDVKLPRSPSVPFDLMSAISLFFQTTILNKHLQELMDGLTAKVFRTYNASITLQQQLKELTSRKS